MKQWNKEKFFGNSPELKKVKKEFSTIYNKGEEKIKNEIEKNELDEYFINLWVDEIKKYISDLGLENNIEIDLNRIHLLNDSNKNNKKTGEYFAANDLIVIFTKKENLDIHKKINRYHSLLHELIHKFSYKTLLGWSNENQEYLKISKRVGYFFEKTKSDTDKIYQKNNLSFFNESVTEKITLEILNKNLKKLTEKLYLNIPNGSKIQSSAYITEREKLNLLIENLSKKTQESADQIWKKIKYGYFNGDLSIFKKIKKELGFDLINQDINSFKENY